MSELLNDQVLKVSASSNPQTVASAIANSIYENKSCKLRAIGAGAVNQTVKAIAIARGYTAPKGYDLKCIPGFSTITSHDGDISAIVFTILS